MAPSFIASAVVLMFAAGSACRGTPASKPDRERNCPTPSPSPLSTAIEIEAEYATARLSNDPDDSAIWVHPLHPERSLIIATMKVAAPAGAIVAFGMDGQIRQMISGIDRPNNIDVEYGFALNGRPVDIAVATERLKRQLRVFRIEPGDGRLVDLGGIPVLSDQTGEAGAPMGIALYKRPRDGAIFAIIAPKEGPREGYLWQVPDRGSWRQGDRGVHAAIRSLQRDRPCARRTRSKPLP